MRKVALFFLLMIFVLGLVKVSNATVITLQPGPEGKDTWIWDSEDFSHGNWGELRVNDSSAYLQYALIEFDLSSIPVGSTISSANLGFYRYDGYSYAGITFDSHQIQSSWNEDVTWSTKPIINSTIESSTTVYGTGWYLWDITSITQQWINGVDNYGVAIYDHGSSYYQRFVSSDNADATQPSWALPPKDPQYRPYLKVDVVPIPPIGVVPIPPTCLLFLSGLIGMVGIKRKVWKA